VRVRQGRGVQLFGRTEESDLVCKYAGEWRDDKKNGQGHCVYPDGSEFKGRFVDNVFEGEGSYSWPVNETTGNRNVYCGQWAAGKMEGKGEFRHHSGYTLKGLFRANLFSHERHFLNPLDDMEASQVFLHKSEQFIGKCARERKEHEESVRVLKVQSQQDLEAALHETRAQNRTPLLTTSLE